jgi:G3E family GTPase
LTDVLNTGQFDLDEAELSEAWQEELESEHIPETEESGIGCFTVRERRPFHPQRLYNWLQKAVPGVARAKGFFWVPQYPQLALFLSQAGTQKQIDLAGYWWSAVDTTQLPREAELRDEIRRQLEKPWGDRRQELVFIGMNVDESAVRRNLEQCVMTDEELAGMTRDKFEERCSRLPNPFAEYIAVPEEV